MEMANATALVGGSAELRCSVISDLTPYIQWRRHFTDVNGSYVNLTNGLAYANEIQVSRSNACHFVCQSFAAFSYDTFKLNRTRRSVPCNHY